MISFKEIVNEDELYQIEEMAILIWHEHYTPIIGADQVVYMLKKFQSVEAMFQQIRNGYRYFRIDYDKKPVGYLSFEKRGAELFLSKIYILKVVRGKGVGKKALEFIMTAAQELSCEKVTLTVNKFNLNAIKAYERSGFVNKGPAVKDIGNGFVMDDYVMEKIVDH